MREDNVVEVKPQLANVTGRFSVQRDLRKVRKYHNVSVHKASDLDVFHLSLE